MTGAKKEDEQTAVATLWRALSIGPDTVYNMAATKALRSRELIPTGPAVWPIHYPPFSSTDSFPPAAPVIIATTSDIVFFCGVVTAARRPRRMI